MSILKKSFQQDRFLSIHRVDEDYPNLRLDQFCLKYLNNFSRQDIKKKIKSGEIKIAGRKHPHRPSTKVRFRDEVSIEIRRTIHEDEFWRGKKIELIEQPEIIYEDEEIYAISKPPFMSTHPTGRHLFNCATVIFEQALGKTCHSIHRLDRETSGVLILGKNPEVSAILTPQFESKKVKKSYFFIAKSNELPRENAFVCHRRLGGQEKGLKRVYINDYPENSIEGKSAKTEYKILHREKCYALGLAFPHTGRQHQIRVHARVHWFTAGVID